MHVILHIDNQLASKFILLMIVIQQFFIQIEGPIEGLLMKILLSNHIILLEVGFYVAPEALLSFKIVSSVIPVVVLDQREKSILGMILYISKQKWYSSPRISICMGNRHH